METRYTRPFAMAGEAMICSWSASWSLSRIFDFLLARLQDEEFPVLRTDVDLSIRQHRRAFLDGAQVLLPQLTAGVEIESEQVGAVIYLIKPVAVRDGGGVAGLEAGSRPTLLRFVMSPLERASIAAISPISLVSRFSSLCVTISDVAVQRDSGIYAALADDIFPHGLAGPDFDRVNGAIATAGDQQASPSTSATIGGEYVVSNGRPPGELIHTGSPVRLS